MEHLYRYFNAVEHKFIDMLTCVTDFRHKLMLMLGATDVSMITRIYGVTCRCTRSRSTSTPLGTRS